MSHARWSRELSSCFITARVCVCVWGQVKPSVPQLFGDIDDEDSDKDDGTRFNIRPQFEGPKGQKVKKSLNLPLRLCGDRCTRVLSPDVVCLLIS